MTGTWGPQQIKQIVLKNFEELGAKTSQSPDLNETLLLHDGHYVARSYRAGGLMAMWFVDNGFIQFYDDQGEMLRTVELKQDDQEGFGGQRRAA